jgi:hypothetical protein
VQLAHLVPLHYAFCECIHGTSCRSVGSTRRGAKGLGLVGERPTHGVFDPPRAVVRELAPVGRVKSSDGCRKADVPLADKVEQRQADALKICSRAFLSPFLMRAANSISSCGVSSLTFAISRKYKLMVVSPSQKLRSRRRGSPREGSNGLDQRANLSEQFFELEWLVQDFELVQPCNLVEVSRH